MVPMAGTYQLERNENFVEYLRLYGIPEDQATAVDSQRPRLRVLVEGTKILLVSETENESAASVLMLDEEVDEPMPNNIVLKTKTTLDGNCLIISSKTPMGKAGTRIYQFTNGGLVVCMSSDIHPTIAKRIYRKIE